MSKQTRNIDNIISNVRGKFFTIAFDSSKARGKFCAKLVNDSNSYITVRNVNTKEDKKLHKNSVTSIVCGQHRYAR